jgi:hypothetical protein
VAVAATREPTEPACGSKGRVRVRHRREETVLHQVLSAHFEQFVERAEEAGGLPKFVVTEVREFLRCGRLEFGLLHCRCQRCGYDEVCAFSCKRRGFCPSCLGRRMTDTALNLVERVLPDGVPVRQWVCSLPWRLRVLCGYDSALCADVVKAFDKEVSRSLQHRAKQAFGLGSVEHAHTGSVLFIQRFDSALRLNVHAHLLSLDGVYVRGADGALVFHELAAPSAEDVAEVARRTAARLIQVLNKHGREVDPELGEVDVCADADATSDPDTALSACYAAAATGTDLFGERAGSPALRLVDPSSARPHQPVAIAYGVNVHAAVRVHGNDRAQLERLCRYLGRPPIAEERLTRTEDGRLRYELKRAWKDGTRAVILSPLDLCARVCALIPRPGFHMVRYYGVLSSHSSLRQEVVPEPAPSVDNPLLEDDSEQLALGFDGLARGGDHTDEPQSSAKRRPWAWMLRHVWQVDVSTCPRCGGAMRWVEVATAPDAIARVLAELEHPGGGDGRRVFQKRSRPPPEQLRFGFG